MIPLIVGLADRELEQSLFLSTRTIANAAFPYQYLSFPE